MQEMQGRVRGPDYDRQVSLWSGCKFAASLIVQMSMPGGRVRTRRSRICTHSGLEVSSRYAHMTLADVPECHPLERLGGIGEFGEGPCSKRCNGCENDFRDGSLEQNENTRSTSFVFLCERLAGTLG